MKKFTMIVCAFSAMSTFALADGVGLNDTLTSNSQDSDTLQDRIVWEKMMMKDLTLEQKATANLIMGKLTEDQRRVWSKKSLMCARDPHKGMDINLPMTESMKMDHMNIGLNYDERETMKRIWNKLSNEQKPVAERMMMNCCVYGMKHAKG
ncbi:MAG: hypothetical protein K8R88_01735 [Armatimonadetes bacterium]|nr:hypothetical protein [Armatimonadota bacterium]